MGQSLADAAVRGNKTTNGLSDEARKLLDDGDVAGLLAFHRQTFGGFQMVEDDDADDDHDDEDADDADEDDEDDADDDEDDKDDKKKSKSAAQKRIEELSAEAARHRKRASQRGRRLKELEAEIEKLKSGKSKQGKEDEDDESEDATQLKEDFTKVLTDNEQLRIENAFLRNNKFRWKNPKAALKLADLSEVEIDDDGEVEGLDEALAALAESDPYLLASEQDGDDEDDEDKPKRKRTGQPTGKSKGKGNPNRDKLIAKYPALRR